MSGGLVDKNCVPCKGNMPPLLAAEIEALRKEAPEWKVINSHHLFRKFKFRNFAGALAFVNRVGALAESEGHHPDISFGWGYVDITSFTHAVDGLSENDFILAAKINALLQGSTLPARRPARSRNAGGSFGAGGNREKG